MTSGLTPNETYYMELGEGRWRGRFEFRILDFRKFMKASLPPKDRALGVLLHTIGKVPGEAVMNGEISCDPNEGDSGVARVDVSVHRFGLEIYRLRGHYALKSDGVGVDIKIYQRFGPYISPLENTKLARAEIEDGGYLGVYFMKILGEDWIGKYVIQRNAKQLDAKYECPWGETIEQMDRLVTVKPADRRERLRWHTLLEVARELEALDRTYEVAGDERALFAYTYGVVTRSIAFSIAQTKFDDPDWVVSLARAFARRFIKATKDHDAMRAPPAWTYVFDAIATKKLSSVDHLVLCVAAHILHDLPLALLEVGMTDENGIARTADYHRMNEVLSESIDLLQLRLSARYNPVFGWLDLVGADLDELFARAGVEHARAIAWYTAHRLQDEARYDEVLDEVSHNVAETVLRLSGRDRPRRLALRGVHAAVRLLKRTPKFPTPSADEFKRANLTPSESRHLDGDTDLLYGLHTAVAQARDKTKQADLASSVSAAIRRTNLPVQMHSFADRIASKREWEDARRRADHDVDFKWRLGALVARLTDADSPTVATADLGITTEQANAIRDMQTVLGDGLRNGFDTIQAALKNAVKVLDVVGVPASQTLGGFDDLRAHYDPATDQFEVEAPTVVRRKFADIRWLIEPPNWEILIPHMLDSGWVQGPDAAGSGIIREVVNVWHPWIDNHPLLLENELAITQTDTPTKRVVTYRLHKSIDGSLTVDDGHISLFEIEPDVSLLVIKKILKVRPGQNPLLYAMLRANPDGLAYLLTYWVNTITKRFGAPDPGSVP